MLRELEKFVGNLIGWERAWNLRRFVEPNWHEGYKNLRHPCRQPLTKWILESNPKTVLEIGCGMGVNLKYLKYLEPNLVLIGVDSCRYIVERAREWLPKDIFIYHGSFEDPIKRRFDVIFTAGSFIYAKNKKEALARMVEHADRVLLYEYGQFLEVKK